MKLYNGMGVDGLLKLYNDMGVSTLSRDMATLGIPAEGTQQQLAALRSAVRHLRDVEPKVTTTVAGGDARADEDAGACGRRGGCA